MFETVFSIVKPNFRPGRGSFSEEKIERVVFSEKNMVRELFRVLQVTTLPIVTFQVVTTSVQNLEGGMLPFFPESYRLAI